MELNMLKCCLYDHLFMLAHLILNCFVYLEDPPDSQQTLLGQTRDVTHDIHTNSATHNTLLNTYSTTLTAHIRTL